LKSNLFPDEYLSMLTSNRPPQVIVAQLGARMHYAVPVILHRGGMLSHFFTDAYVGRGSSWHWLTGVAWLIPEPWRPAGFKRLLARREDSLPPDKVTAFNTLGWRYARDLARATDWQEKIDTWETFGREFCRLVLKEDVWQGDAIYAFQGAALPLLEAGVARGLATFFEQFSAPDRIQHRLFSEEHSLWPDWESPYPPLDLFQSCLEMEEQEWAAADTIICGSDFVAQGLASQGVSPEKIQVVPYGFEVSCFAPKRWPWDGHRPLRVLFVGGVTLRKGVQYLYQALEKLASVKVEARLVGPVLVQEPFAGLLRRSFELTGRVPRPEVRQHYQWGDIFVFPSICEGSATVTYEALAAGLPVITTPHAGSVVRDGVDGFIVPIRDPEAIAEKIDLLVREPERLDWMSQNARNRAQEYSLEKYGKRLANLIEGQFQRSI